MSDVGRRPPMARLSQGTDGVSPDLATVLMVAITVVVAASLFIFSQQLGVGTTPPGTLVFSIHDAQDRAVVISTSGDVAWEDIEVRMSEDGGWALNGPAATGFSAGVWYPAGAGPAYARHYFELCRDIAGPLVFELRHQDPGLGITKLTLVD